MSDPLAANRALVLPCDALFGGAPALQDFSPCGLVGTMHAGATVSSAQSRYGGASLSTPTGAYVLFDHRGLLDFGTADFCVEGWAYPLAKTTQFPTIFSNYNTYATGSLALNYAHDQANVLKWQVFAGGPVLMQSATNVAYNTWTHFAVERSGNTLTLYLNGVVEASASVAGVAFNRPERLWYLGVSGNAISQSGGNCFIDDFRVTRGVAPYGGAFTPPGAIPHTPWSLGFGRLGSAIGFSPYAMPAPRFSLDFVPQTYEWDFVFGGLGRITGTVRNTPDTPVIRRVRLHRRRDGQVVRETWSDAAGNYAFTRLNVDERYYAVGFDHTGTYQGVVADNLTAEVP